MPTIIHHAATDCSVTPSAHPTVERGGEAVAILTAVSRSPLLTPSLPSPSSLGTFMLHSRGGKGRGRRERKEGLRQVVCHEYLNTHKPFKIIH